MRKDAMNELKFVYSENATKFCEIFTLLLTTVHTVKSKVNISQKIVAFSDYMNFITREFVVKDLLKKDVYCISTNFLSSFLYSVPISFAGLINTN